MALTTLLKHLSAMEHAGFLDSNFFVVLILFLGVVSLKLILNLKGGKLKFPPGPPGLPILGNAHQLGTLPHHSLLALSKKYGPVMQLHIGHTPTVVISSEQAAREMIKEHDITISDRPDSTAAKVFFYGPKDIAFSPYGDYWRKMRKFCVVELLSPKRVQSFHSVREEEVSILLENICKGCPKGVPVNLSQLILSVINSISCRCFLGRKFEEKNAKDRFAELTKKLAVHFMDFSFHDFCPLFGWMDAFTGLIARFKKTFQEIDGFLDQAIEEHKNHVSDDAHLDKCNFVHALLKLQKDGMLDFGLTKDHLKAIILDMISAGTDTTFTLVEWTIAELIKHPNIMKKVQEEIRCVVGTRPKIEEKDIAQMKYLKCVVKETLRTHPSAPLSVPRESSSSFKVVNYDIPAKCRVIFNIWAIQRDPKIWDRPEEFFPERFQNYTIDSKGQDFNYMPFGGGRRGCPGMTFGTTTAEYVLANLLYWFNWKMPGDAKEDDLDMSEGYGVTTPRKMPLILLPSMHSP